MTILTNAVRPADSNSTRSVYDSSAKFLAADKALDTVYPYISSLTPPNNATNVSLSQVLTVVFSEPMTALKIVKPDGYPDLPGDGQTTISGATTITVTPGSGLQPNTTYCFVFVASGLGCSLGTMDYTGNQLVSMAGSTNPSSVVWTFTTGAQ